MQTPLTTSHLSCQISNSKHGSEHTIYYSSDATANVLTLVVSTDAKEAHFTPGTPTPRGQAATSTGSLLYLKLTDLHLTDAEFGQLKVTLDGWKSQNFNDAGGKLVCLTPTRPVTLKAGESLTFQFEQFVLANKPPESFVNLALFTWHVVPITKATGADEATSHCAVNVLPPPDTNLASLYDVLHILTDISKIVNSADPNTPLFNRLHLLFQAQGQARPQIKVDQNTEFKLSFVYAEDALGYGALATVKEAKAFSVTPDPSVAANWTVTPVKDVQAPYWILKPQAGGTLLGSNDFDFLIEHIATCFQPGPTTLYVQYHGIPGYQNGVYTLSLEKAPQVTVPEFKSDPESPSVDANGLAAVTLSWIANDATILTLDWHTAESQNAQLQSPHLPSVGDQPTPPIPVTGRTSYPVSIRERTEFILTAEGEKPDNLVDNRVIKHCTVAITPMIHKFEIVPLNDPARTTYSIAWDIVGPHGTTVKLSSNGPFSARDLPGLSGSLSPVTIDETQILTLTAIPPTGVPIAERDWEVPPVWQNTEIGTFLYTGIDRALGLSNFLNVALGAKPGENSAPEISDTLRKLSAGGGSYLYWARQELGSMSSEEAGFRKTLATVGWGTVLPEMAEAVQSVQTHFEAIPGLVSATDAVRQAWGKTVLSELPGALEKIHTSILGASQPLLTRFAVEMGAKPDLSTTQRFLVFTYMSSLIGLQAQGNAALLNALVRSGSVDDQKKAIRLMKSRYNQQQKNFAGGVQNGNNAYRNDTPPRYVDAGWSRFFILGQFEAPPGTLIVGIKFEVNDFPGINVPFIATAPMDAIFSADASQVTWTPMPESSRVNIGDMRNLTLDLTPIEAPPGSFMTGFSTRLVDGNRLSLSIRTARVTEAGLVQGDWIVHDAAENVSEQLSKRDYIDNQYLFINANALQPNPVWPLAGVAFYVHDGWISEMVLPGNPAYWTALYNGWKKQMATSGGHITVDHDLFHVYVRPKTLRVPQGALVTWFNNGGAGMSVDAGDLSIYSIDDQASGSLKFETLGEHPFTCHVGWFSTDTGTVIVI